MLNYIIFICLIFTIILSISMITTFIIMKSLIRNLKNLSSDISYTLEDIGDLLYTEDDEETDDEYDDDTESIVVTYKQIDPKLSVHEPYKGSDQAAGFDLYGEYVLPSNNNDGINIEDPNDIIIQPGGCVIFGTNIAMEIPNGYYLDICPRSGLGINEGLQVSNSPARIDSDYRGEILIGIRNTSNLVRHLKPGTRIAQCTLHKLIPTKFIITDLELSKTERSDGGLGHSGK